MTEKNPLQDAINEHMGQQTEKPLAHYEQIFAEVDPEVISARSGIPFEGGKSGARKDDGEFHLILLGKPLTVRWPSMDTTYDSGDIPGTKVRIILADLLLHHQLVPSSGKFIPYTDVPWGNHYYKAFQGRCLIRLAYLFNNAQEFSRACEMIGGTRIAGGDAAYEFDFVHGADGENADFPAVMVRVTIWEGDDEFPPSSQILFSDNAPLAFTAEDLAAVGDIILNALRSTQTARNLSPRFVGKGTDEANRQP